MNYYWNGKITTIVENLKLLLLLEIICSNCCYWRLFIGVVVRSSTIGMEKLMLLLEIGIVVVETIIKPTIAKVVVIVVKH
jgi:hypothetical protein